MWGERRAVTFSSPSPELNGSPFPKPNELNVSNRRVEQSDTPGNVIHNPLTPQGVIVTHQAQPILIDRLALLRSAHSPGGGVPQSGPSR